MDQSIPGRPARLSSLWHATSLEDDLTGLLELCADSIFIAIASLFTR